MGDVTTDDVAGYLNNNAWRYLETIEILRGLLNTYRLSEEGRNAIYTIYSRRHRQPGGDEFKAARKIKEKTNKMRTSGVLRKNDPDPSFPIQHIGDIIAMTIVCFYPSDKEIVRTFILSKKQQGLVDIYDDEDKRDQEGYVARHLIIGLTDPKFAGIRCEVQIKTLVHDAWTAWTHDLTYKPKGRLRGSIREHMQDLSGQLSKIEKTSQQIRHELWKWWDQDRRKKETIRLRLFESMFSKPPTDADRTAVYERILEDLRMNAPTYRRGRIPAVRQEIKEFARNKPDLHSAQLLLYLALLRDDDDLDYDVLDMIDHWVFSVDGLERLKALTFKGLAYWGFHRYDEAIDTAEKALHTSESVTGGPFSMVRQNLAHYLAELGGEPDSHVAARAREFAQNARLIAQSKNDVRPQLLDTLGFVEIIFGRNRSEIEGGLTLCRRAYELSQEDFKEAQKGFLELHEEIAGERLEDFPEEPS